MAHYNNKRSNANTENINVRDLASSGFDLSYKSKDSGRIGMRELVGYEYVLSGDKMRVSTSANLQYQPTSSPMLPSMDMRIEHVFVPFRNINNDYEDMLSYVKGEAWNEGQFPTITLPQLLNAFAPIFNNSLLSGKTIKQVAAYNYGNLLSMINSMVVAFRNQLKPYYINDYADLWYSHVQKIVANWDSLDTAGKRYVVTEIIYSLIQYFVGEGSNLDKLNCPIIHRTDFEFWLNEEEDMSIYDCLFSCANMFGLGPISVHVLRALYADWFETTRDANLEPAKQLPRYHKLGNSVESVGQIVFCYLVPRFALLGKDLFTTAQIDSPYRHVVAPINTDELDVQITDLRGDLQATQMQRQTTALLTSNTSIAGIIANNYGTLRNFMQNTEISALGLDLVALKRAKQAKDWLMRGHVFGDEYQDYVLAQYGVKIDDGRINKPLYLGGYSQEVNIDQTTNPTATSEMPAGAKNCTMTSAGQSESYDFFSQENGIVLTWLYIAPSVTYEPYEIRNTILKGVDFPTPVFANDSEELSCRAEISRRVGGSWLEPFGRHPYAHAWRSRVDENHSQFLREYKPYTFLREFNDEVAPTLNAAFIHTHVNLNFMVDTDAFNPIWFGTISHNNYVERKLPIVTDEC